MDDRLRALADEFDHWADDGRGEGMAEGHAPILRVALAKMDLPAGGRFLDLGCGVGWATRLLAELVEGARVAGVDLSPRMIERARVHPDNGPRVDFRVADAHNLPFADGTFSRLISVESLYYYPEPRVALEEAARVVEPGGTAYFLLDLYEENEATHLWVERLDVPVHLLSADAWCDLLERAGFVAARHERVHDPRPVPETYEGRWFDGIEGLRSYREEGSLLLCADVEPHEDQTEDDAPPERHRGRDRFV
jgi:SAM-dependent methyltransferase